MSRLWIGLPLALCLGLVACQKHPSPVGTWEGRLVVPSLPGNASREAIEANKMRTGATQFLKVPLTVSPNGTFTTTRMLLVPVDGKWRQEGAKVFFEPTMVLGAEPGLFEKGPAKAAAQPFTGVLSADGKELILEEAGDEKLTFSRT